MYKILVVSLPGSRKREKISRLLHKQGLSWEWVDGVRIRRLEDVPLWERDSLEAYHIDRLKTSTEYVCRAVGCKRAMMRALALAELCREDWTVVMQDDAEPIPDFDRILKELLVSVPSSAGVVMLHRSEASHTSLNVSLKRLDYEYRSMTAFAVRSSFARCMTEAMTPWGGEADRIWRVLMDMGESIYCTDPVIVHCSQKNSDIITGIPELNWLWR